MAQETAGDTNGVDHEMEDTKGVEILEIDKAVREHFGISLEELGPPGSEQRECFIERYLAKEVNNKQGD